MRRMMPGAKTVICHCFFTAEKLLPVGLDVLDNWNGGNVVAHIIQPSPVSSYYDVFALLT